MRDGALRGEGVVLSLSLTSELFGPFFISFLSRRPSAVCFAVLPFFFHDFGTIFVRKELGDLIDIFANRFVLPCLSICLNTRGIQ